MQIHTTQQEFDKRLKKVILALCTSLRFQQCALYIHENEEEFCLRISAGITQAQERYLRQYPLSTANVKMLMDEAKQVNNVYAIPRTSALWQSPSTTDWLFLDDDVLDLLFVPLMSEQHTFVGLLVLGHSYTEKVLTDEALLFLDVFAEQAAMVIEEERLYKEAKQSNEERTALIEIGRALFAPSALHDMENVYRTIYEQTSNIMPVDALLISSYNHDNRTMTMEYLIDEDVVYPPTLYNEIPIWIDKALSGEKHSYILGTVEEYDAFAVANQRAEYVEKEDYDLYGNGQPSQSYLFVPIFYGDELIGSLSAQSYQRYAYTQRHLTLLKEIGVHAGIALTNALLYTKLRQALKEAQKSEQLTNHFLMTASHELRTPLTSVQGYLELLAIHATSLDDEMKQRFVGLASRACEELILLLGNVMDTSRVHQDQVTLLLETVQVRQAVQHIAEILEPTFTKEHRTLHMNIDEHWHVQADDLRLRQILLNVVGNALKYAPSEIAITVTSVERTTLEQCLAQAQLPAPASTAHCFIIIAIRDWGPSIAQQDITRLFTKFVRLESAMNSIQRGAGLGLYLCRQLAEAMGGQIWAESAGIPGEGTTFLLALPQA